MECLADGANAHFFAPAIEDADTLPVSSLSLFEVFKRVLTRRSENETSQAGVAMQPGRVIDLAVFPALEAARLSAMLKLPVADSIILATARVFSATLWTQVADFRDIADVQFIEKTRS